MNQFEVKLKVRQWVEYTHVVEAEDEEDAIDKALEGIGLEDVSPIQDEMNDEEGEPIVNEIY